MTSKVPNQSIDKYIFITGASSGIGAAMAKEYAQPGHLLILGGRNEDKLAQIARSCESKGATTHVCLLDITQTDALEAKVELLKKDFPRIDVLVNNAGLSQRSRITDTSLDTHRRIFEVNYFGTIELTRHILEWMLEKKGGTIAVISSMAGKFGFPLRSSYSASKHALLGYFGTLDLEHKDDGIVVCMVCPGRINTPISISALQGDGSTKKTMDRGLANGMDVDKCAKKIIRSVNKGKYMTYVGGKELIMVALFKFFPFLFRIIARRVDPE